MKPKRGKQKLSRNKGGRPAGIVSLEPYRASRERVERVLALWDEGLSQSEIGRRIGVTPQAIGQTLKRWGTRPRDWMRKAK